MNKAFVREVEEGPSRCPRCGSVGDVVGEETLRAHLSERDRQRFVQTALFCPHPRCPVVYFDDFGAEILRDSFTAPIPVKDVDAPLCSCFGLTRDDIESDVAEGVATRTKAVVQRAQSAEARCRSLAPNGRSCLAAVQGYFMKCWQQAQSGRQPN
jgi:hypothetical protein